MLLFKILNAIVKKKTFYLNNHGKGGVFYKSKNFYDLKKKISLFLANRSIFLKKNKLAKKNLDRFILKNNICKYDKIFREI